MTTKPPVNKGTLRQGCITYRVVAFLKEAGQATSREVHMQGLRDRSAQQVRDTLNDLVKTGRLYRVGWLRVKGVRLMALYSTEPPTSIPAAAPAPRSQSERDRDYAERSRMKVTSVFDFRGRIDF